MNASGYYVGCSADGSTMHLDGSILDESHSSVFTRQFLLAFVLIYHS